MRVHVADPAAFTPPYDRALGSALARCGANVVLWTSRFAYGDVPAADGVDVREAFYGWAPGAAGSRVRRASRLLQHVPDMLRLRRAVLRERADVVHFQWLPLQAVDARLLDRWPTRPPRVLTAHDVLPREPRPGQLAGQRALYERMDAVVVHSEHGAARLRDEAGVDPALVHVIPHGPLDPSPAGGVDPMLPPELAAPAGRGPVVLCFGLIRRYKGVDVLMEAWRRAERPAGAELWVVGNPRMDVAPLLERATDDVRFVLRFVSAAELAGCFAAADLVVLPYREIDQSGVLWTALGAGRPVLASAVGGFPEVAATGAAELVPSGDADALAGTLSALLGDPARRAALAAGARAAAAPDGPHGWDAIARRTLALYAAL